MEGYEWIVTLPGLCAIALTGMLMHFFKQKIKGETLTDIRQYFSNNFKSTFTSFVSTIVAVGGYYFSLATEMPADILTVFGLGYMCDSFFNKWDKPQ